MSRPRIPLLVALVITFGVVLMLLRLFVVWWFVVPSSSMRPTVVPGDLVMTNRLAYGLRLPLWNTVLVPGNSPNRGDIVVFHYPPNPDVDFIKRVVGLPGEVIEYKNKHLFIDGVEQPLTQLAAATPSAYRYLEDRSEGAPDALNEPIDPQVYTEKLGNQTHKIFVDDAKPPVDLQGVEFFKEKGWMNFPDNCTDDDSGFRCTVPAHHYFVLGDNRDHSSDSRYWGFVPDADLIGKAILIVVNVNDKSRIGQVLH